MTSCSHKLIVLEFPSTRYMYLQILKKMVSEKKAYVIGIGTCTCSVI